MTNQPILTQTVTRNQILAACDEAIKTLAPLAAETALVFPNITEAALARHTQKDFVEAPSTMVEIFFSKNEGVDVFKVQDLFDFVRTMISPTRTRDGRTEPVQYSIGREYLTAATHLLTQQGLWEEFKAYHQKMRAQERTAEI